MVGLIVITHCQIAQELVKAAELILGKIPACVPIGIAAEEKLEKIAERLEAALAQVDEGEGALILTDLFGGTPSNVSLSFLQDKKVEVVSGVNLPMILKISVGRQGKDLRELVRIARDAGRKNISIASEIMKKKV
jgi:PTS system mannose-specific IIA component